MWNIFGIFALFRERDLIFFIKKLFKYLLSFRRQFIETFALYISRASADCHRYNIFFAEGEREREGQ
jgi:hypothetical protein